MPVVFFITHPEVEIDPAVDVVRWGLSAVGRARMTAFARSPALRHVRRIVCSTETKAVEAAAILGAQCALPWREIAALGENDRSATGFLHKPAFEAAADAFFAQPATSYRGWERAVDAQARIVAAVEPLLASAHGGDVAIVSHGAVGTLLKCHLRGIAITRGEDQPAQGHVYRVDASTRTILHDWRRLEAVGD